MKKLILCITAIPAASFFVGCASSPSNSSTAPKEAKVLYISGIPDHSQSDLNNCFNELASILSKGTGIDCNTRK